MAYGYWKPYVSVAKRRANARKEMDKLRKKGMTVRPVEIEGRKITRTFWGTAWCDHLEQFSDYANRLPRGKTYVRNGSVCHLEIDKGEVKAIVSGSELYNIKVAIKPLAKTDWKRIQKDCAGQIGSLLELLQGKLSDGIMAVVTHAKTGLFPQPKDIRLNCDCPDWAGMCKHLAAVLYGVGALLDQEPELLFKLRGVNHEDLVSDSVDVVPQASGKRRRLDVDLGDVFGVDMELGAEEGEPELAPNASTGKRGARKAKAKSPQIVAATARAPKKARVKAKSSAAKAGAAKTVGKKAKSAPAKVTAAKVKLPTSTQAKSKSAAAKNVTTKNAAAKNVNTAAAGKAKVATKKKAAFTPTSAGVKRLRKRLDMNKSQFAQLIGVSPSTISLWEGKDGRAKLNLHGASLAALTAAAGMVRDEV